ncbi:hypothetical protein F3Y22_tig00001323pilonHSYRG00009 [Hibiscus syriacus]|uniref:Integrase catalytic domain-containing protein n=1 Tax=Hibiscus syriacus TaxID=106335 RepID=A0A6A3CWC8_HIBSY|nr:hypothetical protein F3Y22_tig00001323pilonHSYRG00009 [Hibiscus syriacus]
MPESTSVTEHLNTLNTLFSQLTSLRCTIGEQERAELLLQSLLDSYDQLIINLTNSNVTSLVFDDVAAAVLQEKNRRKNKEDRQVNLRQAEALTTMTTMRGRSTERGQSSSHKHGRSKSMSKKNLKCYNCGKKASTTVEGRKRFADIWLIDSGTTYHMTSRREWFHHYEPVSGGSVYSCNDHALEIIGVRTIKLKMYDGTIKVVQDVFRGALVVLKGEKIAVNLYMLKGETLIEAEASVVSCSLDSAMLWHQKLGHMSEQGMKVLVEQNLLPGLTKVTLPLCDHCITSKQHRLKFNKSNSRGKSVLELVHSDVWQAPVTSLGGAKYFVLFIDDYSRRCWVYPIKKKSDVFSTFKNFKARVELDSGNKIKCFIIENGREYTSEEFDDFCRKEDIKRLFTVANTPQQNRVAEWMNRTFSINYNIAEDTNGDVDWKCKFLGYADGVKGKEDDDSAEKSETTQIHVEKEVKQGDSSEAEPAHDEQESESSEAPTTCQSDRVRRRPNWHSDYVIEGNVAYCLLIEDGEQSTYQERNGDDQVERYHARLVVKGYAQKEEQLDVKIVFLHENLEEEIYMLQPEGFEEKEKKNLVCMLNKSLYDLKQAPRCWYKIFDSFIMCLGYNRLNADPCAYFKRSGDNDFVILLLYVDDMLVTEPNKDHIEELKAQLAREFEMKDLGSANKILGMQIHRDRSNRKIWLSQKNYLKKICQDSTCKIMSRVPCASAVRSLMFAMICTRPDIAQAVGVVSRYMANPGNEHWNIVKRILRYIKGTSNVALCYGGSNLLINGYVDSDYAGDLDKSKSTTGYVFKVTGGDISWVSKLQSVVATFTTEAEYVAATQASKEAIWLKMLLEELGHNQEFVSLFCDNQSALHLARNPTFHSRTKHIRVQYHFIREKVEEGTIYMQKIHTNDNIADFMTKAINADKFTWCRSSCGLSETSRVHLGLNEIKVRKETEAEKEEEEEPLSPMARMFHEPESNVYVILIVGFKSSINPHSFKANLVDTIVKHPRFSSVQIWSPPDMFVEDYISNLSKTQISKSIPIWDCHNLNLKTSDAESTLVIRVHHSLGDGTSLMSLLISCSDALPSFPVMKKPTSSGTGLFWICWSLLLLMWNTLVDICMCVATTYFLKDTQTPLKAPSSSVAFTSRRIVRRTFCLDDVKSVKNATNTTVNDVMLAITQAGLSTYLNRKYAKGDNGEAREGESNLPDSIRLTATLFINMRSSPGALEEMVKKNSKAEWGNKIGYVNFPLKIALKDNPLDYIKDAKATMGRKKATLEAKFRLFMAKLATFPSATMWFSNVAGPQDQISIFGNQVAFIAPSLYGQTVVSYLLFKGKIAIYNS